VVYKLAGDLWSEGEFKAASGVIDPIPRFLVVRVNMGKPSNATPRNYLKSCTMFIKNPIVVLPIAFPQI
jgi:hypothetical protein